MAGYAMAAPLVSPSKLLGALQQQARVDACLVCSSPNSASPHFGTVSCLACAAFFRRTVALDIHFQCKKEHKCPIYYELRMICRACRYAKCVAAGMKRHCVQKRRPAKKIKDEVEEGSPASPPKRPPIPSIKAEPVSPAVSNFKQNEDSLSDDEVEKLNGEEFLQQPHSSSVDSFTEDDQAVGPSTSFAASHSSESSPRSSIIGMSPSQLLQHFVNEEKKAMDRRRMMFTSTPLEAVTLTSGEIPYTRAELQPHTLRAQVENVKFDHMLGYEYCMSMPGLGSLSPQEKLLLYRVCSLCFSVTDIGYITARLMNDDEEILVFTDGTYSTCGDGDFSVGWADEDIITMEDKKKLFLEFNQRFFAEIIRPMHECNIDQVEIAVLKALCSWKLGYYEYTNNMRTLAREIEAALFEALNEYYGDRPDRATRVGNLVLMMGNLFEMFRIITEMYKQLDFFNLLKVDNISKALLVI